MFSFQAVTQELVNYLRDGSLAIQIWGKQIGRSFSKSSGRQTKTNFQEDLLAQTNNLMDGFKMNGRVVEPTKQSIIVELLLMKKQQARQQQRIVSNHHIILSSVKSKILITHLCFFIVRKI